MILFSICFTIIITRRIVIFCFVWIFYSISVGRWWGCCNFALQFTKCTCYDL